MMLGQICPNCFRAFPVYVYSLEYDEDDTAKAECVNCGARIIIERRWVPRYNIRLERPQEGGNHDASTT